MEVDLTPDPGEIVQTEYPPVAERPVVVQIAGPVETRELPAVRAGYRTEQNVGLVAVRLLSLEPRRKHAFVLAITGDIWLSSTQAGAMSGAAGSIRVPAGVVWPIAHMDEVWACSADDLTDISIQTDYWSE
ncbi:MAG TPA: hypothetical protein VFY14_06995 [Streptomyces sp.]|jgi:hypothetical protein|nr:hypothetical protein [Streptomyces sp.]